LFLEAMEGAEQDQPAEGDHRNGQQSTISKPPPGSGAERTPEAIAREHQTQNSLREIRDQCSTERKDHPCWPRQLGVEVGVEIGKGRDDEDEQEGRGRERCPDDEGGVDERLAHLPAHRLGLLLVIGQPDEDLPQQTGGFANIDQLHRQRTESRVPGKTGGKALAAFDILADRRQRLTKSLVTSLLGCCMERLDERQPRRHHHREIPKHLGHRPA
jgi:hypothetical protein